MTCAEGNFAIAIVPKKYKNGEKHYNQLFLVRIKKQVFFYFEYYFWERHTHTGLQLEIFAVSSIAGSNGSSIQVSHRKVLSSCGISQQITVFWKNPKSGWFCFPAGRRPIKVILKVRSHLPVGGSRPHKTLWYL